MNVPVGLKVNLGYWFQDGTTIDGMAYSIVDPKFAIDTDKEPVLRVSNHVVTGRKLTAPNRPELELVLSGDRGIDAGVPATIRNIALGGARTSVDVQAAVTIERSLIGAHPDGTPLATPGEQGVVVESGSAKLATVAQHLPGHGR